MKAIGRAIQACFANDRFPDRILGQPLQRFGAAPRPRGRIPTAPAVQAVRLPLGFQPGNGAGQQLPPVLQRAMEQSFGADLSEVRIHVGREAASLGARALTVGSNVYFSPGEYQPHTVAGKQLIRRMVSHVLQQRAGRVASPYSSGVAVVSDPQLEAEAAAMAMHTAGPKAHTQTVQRMQYQHERQKTKKEAVLNRSLPGTCTFTFRSGKQLSVSATLSDPGGDSYIDITGKPFPTAIDMKGVTGITFAPYQGRQRDYSSWEYLHDGQWVGPRLTKLA